MADIAQRLTDEEVSVVARWLSAQSLPAGAKPEVGSSPPLLALCGSGNE
jgi:cytochrome c553